MGDAEVFRDVNEHAACDHGWNLADIQLRQARNRGEIFTLMTIVELAILTKVPQTINLRARA